MPNAEETSPDHGHDAVSAVSGMNSRDAFVRPRMSWEWSQLDVVVRSRRSRAAVAAAILEAAEESPATQLSVAFVAKRARVTRPTFYSHADSPQELLSQVLLDRLEVERRRADLPKTPAGVFQAVTNHVNQYLRVYEISLLDSAAASLHFHDLALYMAVQLTDSSNLRWLDALGIGAAASEQFRWCVSQKLPLDPSSGERLYHGRSPF
ncbi:TetR/AcrR family transcriptional regulator [Plantibacter sp. VKM Ac-2885]|uniref:TetR/AcrR family transcriptional regulator n=1 Tax=Plantibacter sp. VKM Ac-2885 TaxID=2783828 RepID=UPI00188C451D|nr:TetR/AcrR family transcriptional regulator [Plantibacter sp. VKM Ac-2885]MBF4514124.1 TetR/AcrR family transcriptional regulator [Plantibacter sp. VKM Ac-2885]